MDKVVFACTHNAGRSQMAMAFFNAFANPQKAYAISAGTNPSERVHPEVVEVMSDIGIDIHDVTPQKLTDAVAEGATYLITMGCSETCPVIPGVSTVDWPLRDPKGQPREVVESIRDEIKAYVENFLTENGWTQ